MLVSGLMMNMRDVNNMSKCSATLGNLVILCLPLPFLFFFFFHLFGGRVFSSTVHLIFIVHITSITRLDPPGLSFFSTLTAMISVFLDLSKRMQVTFSEPS